MTSQNRERIILFPSPENSNHAIDSCSTGEGKTSFLRVLDDLDRTPKQALMQIVADAIETIHWPNKNKPFGLSPCYRFDSSLLMALEVYCYAQGVYESTKVEERVTLDPILSKLFSESFPNSLLIRRFRREHHSYIKECLLHIFDITFQVRFGTQNDAYSPIDYCVAQAIDEWFEPICGPRPQQEAEERIDQAIFWDGMALAS